MKNGTVIIGNGIAGITTARHLRKNDNQRIRVISSETPYFFSRTALMYVYMGHMKFEHTQPYENWFWEKNKIELIQDYVEKVNPESNQIRLKSGEVLDYDNLVIATGSRTKYFDWPGQDLKGVQGLFSYQDLENLESQTPKPFEKEHPTKRAVIVGAGLIGVELAEMLLTRDIHVTILVRGGHFWGNVITSSEGEWIGKHIASHGVDLRFDTELDEILGDEKGCVRGVKLSNGEELPCEIVGITTGVTPNVEFIDGTGIEVNRGIVVNEYLQTNYANIYAAGDCAEMRSPVAGRKSIEPVWYVGRMMGEALGQTLAGKKKAYNPGPWFNSAKFFDIEYQTYGTVDAEESESQKHFFWKQKGENQFITVAYHQESLVFQGINSFGVRLRHEYFDRMLRAEKAVGDVVGGISAADFDAEFHRNWVKDFTASFQSQTGIKPKKSNILKSLLSR